MTLTEVMKLVLSVDPSISRQYEITILDENNTDIYYQSFNSRSRGSMVGIGSYPVKYIRPYVVMRASAQHMAPVDTLGLMICIGKLETAHP